jgi:hypothetical protein
VINGVHTINTGLFANDGANGIGRANLDGTNVDLRFIAGIGYPGASDALRADRCPTRAGLGPPSETTVSASW